MRRRLESFVIEIVLVLMGAVAAALEAIFARRTDIALLTMFFSLLLALAVVAIRQEIERQVGSAFVEQRIVDSIPDARWRSEAIAELERMRLTFAGWASGTRRVAHQSSLNFQIGALQTVRKSIRAVHVATQPGALDVWVNPNRGFDRLVDAYRDLADHIEKRRVIILDTKVHGTARLNGSGWMISADDARAVCELQTKSKAEGGLGFQLRVLWRPLAGALPPDQLIVDDREVCSIENLGGDRFTDLEITVNDTMVQYRINSFEDLWTSAIPVQHCLAVD